MGDQAPVQHDQLLTHLAFAYRRYVLRGGDIETRSQERHLLQSELLTQAFAGCIEVEAATHNQTLAQRT